MVVVVVEYTERNCLSGNYRDEEIFRQWRIKTQDHGSWLMAIVGHEGDAWARARVHALLAPESGRFFWPTAMSLEQCAYCCFYPASFLVRSVLIFGHPG